jgi:Peptidase inhibitor I9
MKEMLVRVKSKSFIFSLQERFGSFEPVSPIFNIYSVQIPSEDIEDLINFNGVVSVEEDEYFELQN